MLTLKAADRLKNADAVLFDDLSSGPILSYAGAGADMVAVGKRAGRPSPKQDHISKLLVDYAKQGGRIVRLKSGDSGLFGRLEEELVACQEAGIEYEIIPGVPSAIAAAAAIGIPLTRRFTARRVQFVTGHDAKGELPPDTNMTALADKGACTVVFMGKRTWPKLCATLIEHGLPADTPAILAEAIGTLEQNVTRSTVSELAAQLAEEIGTKPALILYGPLAEV
ncbi:MAG: uroporphyrinogen-III C-methyltransferase [Planktomarina sp.]